MLRVDGEGLSSPAAESSKLASLRGALGKPGELFLGLVWPSRQISWVISDNNSPELECWRPIGWLGGMRACWKTAPAAGSISMGGASSPWRLLAGCPAAGNHCRAGAPGPDALEETLESSSDAMECERARPTDGF